MVRPRVHCILELRDDGGPCADLLGVRWGGFFEPWACQVRVGRCGSLFLAVLHGSIVVLLSLGGFALYAHIVGAPRPRLCW